MLMKLREAERLLNETYFIASTIEQRLKLHIPSFIWNQVQQLDSGITKAHFLIVQSMNMNIKLERMMASSSEAERAEFERQMDEMGDGYNG